MHGYDLYKQLGSIEEVSLVWHIKQSQLYALLDKLAVAGRLIATVVPGEAHLQRKEYALTETGRRAFLAWRSSPVEHGRDMRQEFLAKLYFALRAEPEVALRLVAAQRDACQTWRVGFQQSLAQAKAGPPYERLVLEFRLAQVEAMLKWLATCEGELERRPARGHRPTAHGSRSRL